MNRPSRDFHFAYLNLLTRSRRALLNYLYWRGLREEIPIFRALGGCYPSRWDPKCRAPTEMKSHIHNILYHHRLNLKDQLPLMFPDTKLITTVREPVSLLYRIFSLYLKRRFFLNKPRKPLSISVLFASNKTIS